MGVPGYCREKEKLPSPPAEKRSHTSRELHVLDPTRRIVVVRGAGENIPLYASGQPRPCSGGKKFFFIHDRPGNVDVFAPGCLFEY